MKFHHFALAVLVNLIFGFNFVAVKIGVAHFEPFFFTLLRFVIVGAVLAAFIRVERGRMRQIALVAVAVGVFHFGAMFTAVDIVGGVSAIAIAAQIHVPISIILAVAILGEWFGWRRSAGIALAFGGVVVVGFDPSIIEHPVALAFVLVGALAFSIGTILVRRLRGVAVFNLQGWIAVIAAPQLLVISLTVETGQLEALRTAEWPSMTGLVYVALLSTLIGHVGWFYLLRHYPVSLISPFLLLTPLFGVAGGVVLLHDALTWELIVGGGVTIAGVAMLLKGGRAEPGGPPGAPGGGRDGTMSRRPAARGR